MDTPPSMSASTACVTDPSVEFSIGTTPYAASPPRTASNTATIDAVFDAVRGGDAAYGVVPIENSTEGSVTQAVDALIEGGVSIRRELVFEVNQCVMSK